VSTPVSSFLHALSSVVFHSSVLSMRRTVIVVAFSLCPYYPENRAVYCIPFSTDRHPITEAADESTKKKKKEHHRNLRRFQTGLTEINITYHHRLAEKIEQGLFPRRAEILVEKYATVRRTKQIVMPR
jgi:hypothetical protein